MDRPGLSTIPGHSLRVYPWRLHLGEMHAYLSDGIIFIKGFPGGSVVKNSLTNAGDTGDVGLIPRLGRSPREGNGNPLQ